MKHIELCTFCGSNTSRVTIGNLTLWFSYETLIAFQDKGMLVTSENCWSATTGCHLNRISDNKKARLKRGQFEKAFAATLKKYNLIDSP